MLELAPMMRWWLKIPYVILILLLVTNEFTNFDLDGITRSQLLILVFLNRIPRILSLWLLARYASPKWLTLYLFAALFFEDIIILVSNTLSSDTSQGQLLFARWLANTIYNLIVGVLIVLGFIVKHMKHMRRALLRERKMLKGIINALPVAVGVYDKNDAVLLINKLGYEMIGENINAKHSEFDKDKNYRTLLQQNSEWKQFKSWMLNKVKDKEVEGELAVINESMPNREGKRLFDIQAEILPIEPSNAVVSEQEDTLLMVVNDVTERETLIKDLRQARQVAEQSNRAKSRFLANVSHELRTPITSIVGFSQLIGVREDIHDDVVDLMGIITRSGENLLELVNDILDLSKAEANRLTLHESVVEPRAMIFDEVNVIRQQLDAKGLSIDLRLSFDVSQKLVFDEGKVRQILRNLLSNAYKFTDAGSIIVTMWSSDILNWQGEQTSILRVPEIKAKLQQQVRDAHAANDKVFSTDASDEAKVLDANMPDENVTLHIEVHDTGQGIAAEELEDIFEPFMQSRSGIGNLKSTGLGLAICKQYAHFLGGDMTIQSKENVGTRCHFWFKAIREEARTDSRENLHEDSAGN